jgi:hypothetical protein
MKKVILIFIMALISSLAFAQKNTDKTLYIVDGAVSQKAFVDALPKDLINNMEVIKGVESVVVVTTKSKAAADTPVISIRPSKDDKPVNDTEHQAAATLYYRSSTGGDFVPAQPLCIVKSPDGKLFKGDMPSISPDTIKSIHVLKDDKAEAYKEYGDITNGVVLVELK